MPFLSDSERAVLVAIAALADCNPFLPERVELERRALGREFVSTTKVWHAEADLEEVNPNLPRLNALVESLAPVLRERLVQGATAADADMLNYEALVRYLLFQRYDADWFAIIARGSRGERSTGRVGAYTRFAHDVAHFLGLPGIRLPVAPDAAPLFAWGFQVRRAFHHTFRQIFGGSLLAARLRAAIWHSIFTHDPQRYRRALYDRMGDIPTLIVGESGTGKELAARALAFSRYIPFDPASQAFIHDYAKGFHAVNLSALSATLIESELFGHRRGAFTGAVEDRTGWLEACGSFGSVFLDEVGELDPVIQVKLLRVFQTRQFQRIGETRDRAFAGKTIAATNRDVAAEMAAGRFRRDFYYRLCADVITTPTLRGQLADSPDDLRNLILVIARRVAGETEAEELAAEVERWIEAHLGLDYAWPGNMRELEQCTRSVLIRGEYRPPPARPADEAFMEAARAGALSAEELLRGYCTRVYARTRSYQETARLLGLDRRTVRAKIDPVQLARLEADGG